MLKCPRLMARMKISRQPHDEAAVIHRGDVKFNSLWYRSKVWKKFRRIEKIPLMGKDQRRWHSARYVFFLTKVPEVPSF